MRSGTRDKDSASAIGRVAHILRSLLLSFFPTCSLTVSKSALFLRTVWRTEPFGPPQNNSCQGDAVLSFYSLISRAQDEGQPASHLLGGDCFAKGGTRRRTFDTLGTFHQHVIIQMNEILQKSGKLGPALLKMGEFLSPSLLVRLVRIRPMLFHRTETNSLCRCTPTFSNRC